MKFPLKSTSMTFDASKGISVSPVHAKTADGGVGSLDSVAAGQDNLTSGQPVLHSDSLFDSSRSASENCTCPQRGSCALPLLQTTKMHAVHDGGLPQHYWLECHLIANLVAQACCHRYARSAWAASCCRAVSLQQRKRIYRNDHFQCQASTSGLAFTCTVVWSHKAFASDQRDLIRSSRVIHNDNMAWQCYIPAQKEASPSEKAFFAQGSRSKVTWCVLLLNFSLLKLR